MMAIIVRKKKKEIITATWQTKTLNLNAIKKELEPLRGKKSWGRTCWV